MGFSTVVLGVSQNSTPLVRVGGGLGIVYRQFEHLEVFLSQFKDLKKNDSLVIRKDSKLRG